jgi:lipoprotein-releasing system ATP-binding protein
MIEIKNISKQYENTSGIVQEVLLDVNLNIEKGESVAIVGPSGSGKSTLLNIIGSLDTPSSGEVFHDDKNLVELNETDLAKFRNLEIGFVFQQHHLLPQLTMLENALLPVLVQQDNDIMKAANNRALDLFKKVGLNDKINQLPSQCSIGECQRAAVVRSLINQPKVLLADEPTGSLDEKNALDLVELLIKINEDEKLTLIMVTHSLELAKKMKRVFRISNKKLEEV